MTAERGLLDQYMSGMSVVADMYQIKRIEDQQFRTISIALTSKNLEIYKGISDMTPVQFVKLGYLLQKLHQFSHSGDH